MTLPIGSQTQAVFRCHHSSLEAIIAWRVNGSSVREFSDITTSSVVVNNSRVGMLAIPTRSEYNGTVIECVAFFAGSSAPPATLILIGRFDH